MIVDTALSAVAGIIFGKLTQSLPIKGITRGSHSVFQVAKSLITKTFNRKISQISIKSFGKIFSYQLISNFSLGWLLESVFNKLFFK